MRRLRFVLMLALLGSVFLSARAIDIPPFPGGAVDTREGLNLVGPVKSIRISAAPLHRSASSWEEGVRVPILAVTFDQRGSKVEEIAYRADGARSWKRSYIYSASGKKVEATAIGDLVELTGARFVFTYDAFDVLQEVIGYDLAGVRRWRRAFTYDPNGLPQSEMLYELGADGEWAIAWSRECAYDGQMRLAAATELDRRSRATTKLTYAYARETGPLLAKECTDWRHR